MQIKTTYEEYSNVIFTHKYTPKSRIKTDKVDRVFILPVTFLYMRITHQNAAESLFTVSAAKYLKIRKMYYINGRMLIFSEVGP